MTEPTLVEREEANRNAPVPPRFWRTSQDLTLHMIEWNTLDAEHHFAIPVMGHMRVHKNHHAFYWKELESYTDMVAACDKAGKKIEQFTLMNFERNKIVGCGWLDSDYGPHEMAFLSCMFLEAKNNWIGFLLPDGVDGSHIRNAAVRIVEKGEVVGHE